MRKSCEKVLRLEPAKLKDKNGDRGKIFETSTGNR